MVGEDGPASEDHLPDYGVVICDDREYLKALVEGLLFGNFMSNG